MKLRITDTGGRGDPLIVFRIDERHSSFGEISRMLAKWGVSSQVTTKFTDRELRAASWLLVRVKTHGRFVASNNQTYLEASHDLTEACETCGQGRRQKAPCRMPGEPRWGRNGIIQLHFVYDECFVQPAVWRTVFKPHGIACRPVVSRRGSELETVVQLQVDEEVSIVTDDLESETCRACGRTKYHPVTRGRSPALCTEPTAAMARTAQWFGSGAFSERLPLISQALFRALQDAGVRGARYRPVSDSAS